MEQHPETSHLLEPLFAAVSDDANWPEFLDELCRECRGELGFLFVHDYRHGRVPYFISRGIDAAMERDYVARLGAMNPWVADQERMPEGSVVLSNELASDASICRTEYFADFMRPLNVRHAVGSNILKSGGQAVKLGVLRSTRQGPMGERERHILRNLMPALQSAIRLRGRLEGLEARSRMNWHVMESMTTGVLFLDQSGEVTRMNSAAERILDEGDGVCLDGRHRLCARADSDRAWLATALADVKRDATSKPRFRKLNRRSGQGFLVVRIEQASGTPLSQGTGDETIVFVSDTAATFDGLDARIAEAFGLTPAESRLGACLASGMSLDEAAVRLGIAKGTARFVSKRMYAKTGTRGQSDLVRTMLIGVGMIGRD